MYVCPSFVYFPHPSRLPFHLLRARKRYPPIASLTYPSVPPSLSFLQEGAGFWSVTAYTLPDRKLVPNTIGRSSTPISLTPPSLPPSLPPPLSPSFRRARASGP